MVNNIHQQALAVDINKQSIYSGLTKAEADKNSVLSAIFKSLDVNNDGTLSADEVNDLKNISCSEDGVYDVEYGKGTAKYDNNGNCIQVSYKDGPTITNTYDENGCVSEYDDGRKFFYDKNKKLVKSIDSFGTTSIYNEDGSYSSTTKDGITCYFDKNKRFYKEIYPNDITMERTYNTDGSYADTYSDGTVLCFDKDGNITHETDTDGRSFRFEHSENGEYTKYDENNTDHIIYHKSNDDGTSYDLDSYGNICNYDKNGKWVSGKDKNGTYTVIHNEDGTKEERYTDGKNAGTVFYFDKQGRCIRRENPDNSSYRFEYDEKGCYTAINESTNEKTFWSFCNNGTYTTTRADGTKINHDYSSSYSETSRSDGTTIYKNFEGIVAEKNKKGEAKTFALKGESFDDTMHRLGITTKEDIKLFIKANNKAYKKGCFSTSKTEVIIPKELASKVKISNLMKPSMGV